MFNRFSLIQLKLENQDFSYQDQFSLRVLDQLANKAKWLEDKVSREVTEVASAEADSVEATEVASEAEIEVASEEASVVETEAVSVVETEVDVSYKVVTHLYYCSPWRKQRKILIINVLLFIG